MYCLNKFIFYIIAVSVFCLSISYWLEDLHKLSALDVVSGRILDLVWYIRKIRFGNLLYYLNNEGKLENEDFYNGFDWKKKP